MIKVRVDRFPAFVREWVQKRTGKTSVPQIFFNATHVGGNKVYLIKVRIIIQVY